MTKEKVLTTEQTFSILNDLIQDVEYSNYKQIQSAKNALSNKFDYIFSGSLAGLVPEAPLANVYVYLYDDGTLYFSNEENREDSRNATNQWTIISTDTAEPLPGWYQSMSQGKINRVDADSGVKIGYTMARWFMQTPASCNLDNLNKFDVSSVRSMVSIFQESQQPYLNIAQWDVSSVTNMSHTFDGCSKLQDMSFLEQWDVSSVTLTTGMFQYCSQLQDLAFLYSWNVSAVKFADNMFAYCSGLKSLEGLENWDVTNVTSMTNMFVSCRNLQDVSALSRWRLYSTGVVEGMFAECGLLKDITALQYWYMNQIEGFRQLQNMFKNCSLIDDFTPLNKWKRMPVLKESSATELASAVFPGCYGTLPDWATEE